MGVIRVADQSPPRPDASGGRDDLFGGGAELAEQMALVVHELRSPLATTSQVISLLGRRPDSPPDPELLAVAQRQLDAGLRRVEQLLVLLGHTAGRTALRPEPHGLDALVRELTEQQRLDETAHDLVVEIDPSLRVSVDREAFAHVLENLVGNAARHAPAGTPIVIAAQPRGDEVLLRVVDRGPGMTADVLERAFEPFTRGADGGAGLGLTVVRHMVEAHGGRVWFEIDPETPGTCVVVALPAAAGE